MAASVAVYDHAVDCAWQNGTSACDCNREAVSESLIDRAGVETGEPKPLAWEPPGGLNRANVRRGRRIGKRRPR